MRVSHVITRLIVGGAQENTIASVLGLHQRHGLTVDLLSGPSTGREGSLEPLFDSHPGMLVRVPGLVRPIHPWRDLMALRWLNRWFRVHRPNVVHTHSGKAGVIGRIAASRSGVPVIVHTIHGPSFGPFQNAAANGLFRTAERFAGRVTTHFVSVADAMTEQYLRAGIGNPSQYTRIYSGFDLEPFLSAGNDPAERRRLGIGMEDIVVGMIARLFKLKGHDDLFAVAPELIRRFPRVKFLLVGDGPWRGRFETRVRSLGLQEHFVFAGLVPPGEVSRLTGVMDMLVHLSRREGLPRALPQAMAARRPVVAYDCDGAGEVCRNNETGFLIRPGDFGGLSSALARLIQDPALRESLGVRGQAFVRERFAVNRMVDDLHALYCRLAAQKQIEPP